MEDWTNSLVKKKSLLKRSIIVQDKSKIFNFIIQNGLHHLLSNEIIRLQSKCDYWRRISVQMYAQAFGLTSMSKKKFNEESEFTVFLSIILFDTEIKQFNSFSSFSYQHIFQSSYHYFWKVIFALFTDRNLLLNKTKIITIHYYTY